jgi:gas vesicle protein|tara:strand:- start:357 stop:686 length:330 start_codon:yes stop_codon:yes gene_type:complete
MIIFSDSEMASMIMIVRNSDISGSAARLVVGIEDKLISAVKLLQDDLAPETSVEDLEYEVSFDASELNALVQMAASIKTKGSSARAIASVQDKLEPAVQEVEQQVQAAS